MARNCLNALEGRNSLNNGKGVQTRTQDQGNMGAWSGEQIIENGEK